MHSFSFTGNSSDFSVAPVPGRKDKVTEVESEEEDQLKRKARPSRKSLTGIIFSLCRVEIVTNQL